MTILPNSVEARDIAYQMHPNVNLRKFEKTGGLVIESGDGIYVTDSSGKRYIEAMAGCGRWRSVSANSGWWTRRQSRCRSCPITTPSPTRRTARPSILPSC